MRPGTMTNDDQLQVPGSVFILRRDTGIQKASANSQENASCASSVARMGWQELENRANRPDISIVNQNMNNTAGNFKRRIYD